MFGDPATLPWRSEIERCGHRASAALPIRVKGQVRGTLTVYAGEPGVFRDKETALLAAVAGDLSFALDNLERDAARVAAEETVRRERDFSEALLGSLPGVLYLYDSTGRFLRWNQNLERLSGYTPAEISGMQPLQFIAEDDRELVAARIAEVFEKGESSVEAGLRCKDGRILPHYFTGVATTVDGQRCLVGVGIDLTDRKRAEEERRASEGRYRTLFECAPDGILIADAQSRYLDANASICRMLGYSHDELVGRHAEDIVLPEETPHIEPALTTIKGPALYHREWQFRRKDGSTFPADVIATAMPDGHIMGMVRDITDRKEAESALRQLNEKLELRVAERTEELRAAVLRAESADRLKSAFLATMSHELRTPLNSIIGFTGLVLQGLAGPLTAEQSKQLEMVRSSARHLLHLINDVLDLSKIEAGQLDVRAATFDLHEAIAQVIASMAPLAEKKGLRLTATVDDALGSMHSDRRRVEQIALNLLNNAIKFTSAGQVTLTAEPIDGFQSSADAPPAPALRLRVADTGIGIRPQDLGTLFQPFRQIDTGLDRQHEGTGLGLAICRRLANLLGGEISARSEWSKGSEFTVTLPLTAPVRS
jgi:PAS domain S-box-containing protein